MPIHSEAGSRTSRLRRAVLLSAVLALLASVFGGGAVATADASCPTPPPVFPVHDLHHGMTATGTTVIQGTAQTPFDVKILGVQRDGIAPGIDFILAQITGPQSFLDVTGGIVAGMSGSPVSIGGQLVGSTSYGFSFSDQTMIGITPAESMVDLFGFPDPPPAARATASRATAARIAAPRTIRLSPALRTAMAHAAGRSKASAVPGVAHQLLTPLEVSGLDQRGRALMQRFIRNRLHLPVTVLPAAGVSRGRVSSTPLSAGDSVTAAISYGDVTAAAIGTVTATCGDMLVGFGHPFNFTGASSYGMSGARVLQVIKDPSSINGGYKFAVVTGLHGTVDQDRLEGIRGVDGELPTFAHVVSDARNLDIPGRSHDGSSRVSDNSFMPIVAANNMLNGEDAAFDRIGDGSVHATWTVRGTGPDGAPFTLRRDNRYYSGGDATFESVFEILFELQTVQSGRFGTATISSVHTSSQVTQDQLTTSIQQVLVSSGLQPGLAERKTLKVRPGDTIHMRVELLDHGSTQPSTVNMTIHLPARASGSGELTFGNGGVAFGGAGKSFADMIRSIHKAPHQYDLVAQLDLGGGGVGGPADASTASRTIHRQVVVHRTRVVSGRRFVRVKVVRPGQHGGGPTPSLPPPTLPPPPTTAP